MVQDDDGNDAAGFTTGENNVAAVTNGSDRSDYRTAGAPRNVATRPGGADSIVVSWDPPADTGGVAITAYWVDCLDRRHDLPLGGKASSSRSRTPTPAPAGW